jgi:hypothetical protein
LPAAGINADSGIIPPGWLSATDKDNQFWGIAMRIAYRTLDDVNRDLATRLAARAGIDVLSPGIGECVESFDAVVYDLDHLPTDFRDRLLSELASGQLTQVVGVHSYNLTDGQRRALRRRGICVRRRLGKVLMSRLLEPALVTRVRSRQSEQGSQAVESDVHEKCLEADTVSPQ